MLVRSRALCVQSLPMSTVPPATSTTSTRDRVLDPVDRISEVLFGLIMALTFTGLIGSALGDGDEVRALLLGALGCNLAWGLVDGVMMRAAVGVATLVFLSTLPVVVPFALMSDARLALRVSNVIAIVMLFGCGYQLGRYAGGRRWLAGAVVALLGVVLVPITIMLGG